MGWSCIRFWPSRTHSRANSVARLSTAMVKPARTATYWTYGENLPARAALPFFLGRSLRGSWGGLISPQRGDLSPPVLDVVLLRSAGDRPADRIVSQRA
jgi:hypothetical protein